HGCAVPTSRAWRTPLGSLAIDVDGCHSLVDAGLAEASDSPHRREHSLEVQLPFLQRALGEPQGLPLAVRPAPDDSNAAPIAAAGAPQTAVLCSTDLSHYLSQPEARARDDATLRRVIALGPVDVGDACGVFALRGLIAWARAEGHTPRLLHRSTSA